jgi:hypothetical protein
VVEKHGILYRVKKRPILVVLADERPIEYRNGMMRLETELTKLRIAGIECYIDIGIIELGDLDMLISYN